jgi:hypothetical protein
VNDSAIFSEFAAQVPTDLSASWISAAGGEKANRGRQVMCSPRLWSWHW